MKSYQRSVTPDATRLVLLRHQLGWTQQEIAKRAGYSVRLIRKIEKQQTVRPQTLRDIVQCYLDATEDRSHRFEGFVLNPSPSTISAANKTNIECDLVAKVREYYDVVYQQRQIDRIGDYISPSIRFTSEGTSRIGIKAVQQRAKTLLSAFDSIEFLFERIFSKEQIVVASWTVRMRHLGDFFEFPATGNWVEVRGNSILVFADGLAVEAESHLDIENLLRQLTGQEEHTI